MLLQLDSIRFCASKYNIASLQGFEEVSFPIEDRSEEHGEAVFRELAENEMLQEVDGALHISALAQHLLLMMNAPEQFILFHDEATGLKHRVYLKNAYYLCILEKKQEDGTSMYQLELLPNIDLVIGFFAYVVKKAELDKLTAHGKAFLGEELSDTLSVTDAVNYSPADLVNHITEWLFAQINACYKMGER